MKVVLFLQMLMTLFSLRRFNDETASAVFFSDLFAVDTQIEALG